MTNIAVATAFAAPGVQRVAQRIAHTTADLADQALAIIAIAALGLESIKLLKVRNRERQAPGHNC